jgi:hypothetical protein
MRRLLVAGFYHARLSPPQPSMIWWVGTVNWSTVSRWSTIGAAVLQFADPTRRRRPLMSDMTEIGSPAPDFTLPSHLDGEVQLSAMRGTKVAICFYPFDFSGG